MPTAPLLLLSLFATVAEAKNLKPESISASSTYPADENVNYETTNLTDLKASTVWAEGAEGSGLGSFLVVELGGEKTVRARASGTATGTPATSGSVTAGSRTWRSSSPTAASRNSR